jgi:hypothetical protein
MWKSKTWPLICHPPSAGVPRVTPGTHLVLQHLLHHYTGSSPEDVVTGVQRAVARRGSMTSRRQQDVAGTSGSAGAAGPGSEPFTCKLLLPAQVKCCECHQCWHICFPAGTAASLSCPPFQMHMPLPTAAHTNAALCMCTCRISSDHDASLAHSLASMRCDCTQCIRPTLQPRMLISTLLQHCCASQ